MKSQRQASTREEFEVTQARPYLSLPKRHTTWPAEADGERMRPAGTNVEAVEVAVSAQDFLRFRGVRDAGSASEFGLDLGLLGLSVAVRGEHVPDPSKGPLWWRALTQEPQDYHWSIEPLEDWTRQAGLIDFAWGIHGLRTAPQARRSLVAVCESLSKSFGDWAKTEPKTVSELLGEQAARSQSRPWQVRSVLDGAARAGLLMNSVPQDRDGTRHIHLWAPAWRGAAAGPTVELSAEGLSRALADLVNPWLGRFRPVVVSSAKGLHPGRKYPGSLLVLMWAEVVNAVLSQVPPRLCAWEKCPGPPKRPGVFLWRESRRDQVGTRHRDSMYCSDLCQHAAAVKRSRDNNPEYQRQRRQRREGGK